MKIIYLSSGETKKITENNLFKVDNMLEAYELLLDILATEHEQENNFTDEEVKKAFASDVIDLHDGNYCKIIDWNGKGNPVTVANEDFDEVAI